MRGLWVTYNFNREVWSYAIGETIAVCELKCVNEKRSLIPWGLREANWKINSCSRFSRLSVLP